MPLPTPEVLIDGILQGNRMLLSRAITMIESTAPKHFEPAQHIVEGILPHTGNAVRIGISGVPGVGKSTFIESFGQHLTGLGHKVAVLAIDPRSEKTKGSILGDKTRMEQLANDPNAYIRPSSSGGALGGVAPKTRETLLLCEAAGFDVILIETVGVGQSEIQVASMTDFFLLLMLAGAGDELQGIKRGIMEMADAVVITKADGENQLRALHARAEYRRALSLLRLEDAAWKTRVMTCSAMTNEGIPQVWQTVREHKETMTKTGRLMQKRREQASYWFHQILEHELIKRFYSHPSVQGHLPELETAVLNSTRNPTAAAREILTHYVQQTSH